MIRLRWFTPVRLAIAALLLGLGGGLVAPIAAQKGASPGSDAGSYEVGGIDVDVVGKSADAARIGGWRIAQRKGWNLLARRLTGRESSLSDGALDSLSSGIVVESEQLGPNRYIARLGVMFDRSRAAALLGVAGQGTRSPPMLLIPVEYSGGAGVALEQRGEWQQAWTRFRTGNSAVDYVRPAGTGADALLMNAGQTGRRGRTWWRDIVDQYGASDILVAEVRTFRQWPGGPVVGVFTARHGPDNQVVGRFTLRVGHSDALPALLDAGVRKIDDIYQHALQSDRLKLDAGLAYRPPAPVAAADDAAPGEDQVDANAPDADVPANGASVSIQFDTPSAASVSTTESAMRGVPGVRSAITNSLAIGGVSVMRIVFDGNAAGLRAALEARGWVVQEGAGTLRIRRAAPAPQETPAGG